ncbi:MAG: hypothetical protein H7232_09895 [Aeromicrobium sp.]|nr:hypothetical protein [Burkholderiales bacterium]
MISPKVEVASMLSALPDDSSLEDIQYHLYVLEKVKRGLGRAETEGAMAHEDAKTRLGKWLTA